MTPQRPSVIYTPLSSNTGTTFMNSTFDKTLHQVYTIISEIAFKNLIICKIYNFVTCYGIATLLCNNWPVKNNDRKMDWGIFRCCLVDFWKCSIRKIKFEVHMFWLQTGWDSRNHRIVFISCLVSKVISGFLWTSWIVLS